MTEREKHHVKFDGELPRLHQHHHHRHHHHHNVYLTSTPDGGWGWVVIFSTFLVFFFTLGFKTSLGVFYVEWERYFDVGKTQVSWVTSMSPFVIGLLSPFSAGICHAIGPRPPVMLGGIIAAAGILGSSYAHTIYQLILTIGIVSAIGMGFAFAPSIIVLHHYFEKRFVVANGVAFAGIATGELCFPLILQPMIEVYGWRGALFLMAAVELNLVVCGFVMIRPKPRPVKHPHPLSVSDSSKSHNKSITDNNNYELDVVNTVFKESHKTKAYERSDELRKLSTISSMSSVSSNFSTSSSSEEPEPRFLREPRKSIALFMFGRSKVDGTGHQQTEWNTDLEIDVLSGRFAHEPKDHILNQKRKRTYSALSHHSIIEQSYNVMEEFRKERFRLRHPLKKPFFLVMLPIMLLHGIGWYAVIAHLVPFAVDYGVPDYKAFDLIAFIGFGTLVGSCSHGWFIDKNMVSSEFAKIGSLTFLTIITLAYPAAHYSYPAMATLSVIYGIAAGVSLPLFFALVRQLLPPEDVNAGVSLVIIAEMLGDTIGGVSAGLLYDLTHDYEISFFFAGASIAAATFLQLILSVVKRRSNIREKQSYECRAELPASRGFKAKVTVGNPVPKEFVIGQQTSMDLVENESKGKWGQENGNI